MNSKKDFPLVSAIIPTRDRPELLIRAAKTVARQTYRNIEIIIVDDGSHRQIEALIKSEPELRSCKVINNVRRSGAAGARNTGFCESKGEFVGFLDDDDEWMPEKIEKQIEAFEKSGHSVGIVCTQDIIVDGSAKIIRRRKLEGNVWEALRREHIAGNTSNPLIKRYVLHDVGGFDEGMQAAQDKELWIRIAKRYEFTTVDEPLVIIHRHDSNRITGNRQKRILGAYKLLRKHWKDLPARRKFNIMKGIVRQTLLIAQDAFCKE